MFELDSFLGGTILIAFVTFLCICGLFFARRVFALEKLRETHEVGGVLLSVVGTLYAVLLGLIVVDAMTKFQDARNITENEANNLADVYILADCLPEARRLEVRRLCHDYAKEVVENEWKHMDDGHLSPVARTIAVRLMKDLTTFEPQTQNQAGLYPMLVQSACNVWNDRCDRANLAKHGIPPIEWITLIVGGVITVIFTYFFGLESVRIQTVMVGMVALLISLNLYLFMLFGYPFSGDLKVPCEAFQTDIEIFENKLGNSGTAL